MNAPITPFSPARFCPHPPCGGRIGPLPEHFVVEEVPAYPLSGDGEHVFLWVEKTNLTTIDVAGRIARAAGQRERDIGYAGMKDKVAITRQWFSLCTKEEPTGFDLGPGARILQATRHKNKLRTGHLIGNRFSITLVDVPEDGQKSAAPIAEFLNQQGLPNYFGPQRFGSGGRNLEKAISWLNSLGESPKESAPDDRDDDRNRRRRKKRGGPKDRFENKMFPSVIQSEIFNRYVAARLARSEELLAGEVVRLDQAGKCFVVQDVEVELPRLRSGDIHLTGPMMGPKGLQAEADARLLEEEVARTLELSEAQMTALGEQAPGTRRDLFLAPEELEVCAKGPEEIQLVFALPAGAFATQLVREFSGAGWDSPREAASELT